MHGGSSVPAAGLEPEIAPARAPAREKATREWILVLVASFLLAVLPVRSALFDPSQVFFGVDSASAQLPWSRAPGVGALGSPRNPDLADQATFFYPFYRWIARSVEAGDPPLWCPLIYAGVPGLANFQSGVLDPQVGLLVLFHSIGGVELFDWGLALVATLRIFLALSGAYFLARRLGLAPSGAALAGITFGFSGFLLLWLNHALGHVAPFLPWTLFFLEGTRRARPLLSAALGALAFLLAILGGHIETAFFVGAAAGAWSLGILRRSRRAGLFSLGALCLGTALAAVALVPFWEYLELSAAKYVRELRSLEARSDVDWIALGLSVALVGIVVSYRRALARDARRGVLVASAGIVLAFAGVVLVLGTRDQGSFAALALVPDLHGHPRTGGYRGTGYLEAASGWVAFPALLLALAAILSPRGPLVRRGLVATIGVLAFLLSIELPGLLEVYRFVPLVGLGATVRLAVVGSLFLGLLAGEALESAPRAAKVSAAAILGLGLAGLLWPRAPERYAGGLAREPDENELFGIVLGIERIAALRTDGCFEGWLAPEVAVDRARLVLERVESDGAPVAEPPHVIGLELHAEPSELARSAAADAVRAAPAGARWFRTPYADLGRLTAGHWTARVELLGPDPAAPPIANRHAGVATLERSVDRDPVTLAFLAGSALLLLVVRRGGRWLVPVVALAQALHFAEDLNPAVPREQVFPPTRTEEILREVLAGPPVDGVPRSLGPWRFFGDAGVLPPNTGMVRGLPGIEGYDALDVAAFNFYRENVLPSGVNPLLAWNARGVELDNPAFRLYGVGALALTAPLDHPDWELVASPQETEPARVAETWIYRARAPLPRAFCVPRVVTLDELAELWRQDRTLFRPLELACLQEEWRPERSFTRATVSKPRITNNEVHVRAELDGDGLLIVTEQAFPGWTVTVDGEERPVLTADLIFRGVALESGTHDVVFRYRPHTLRAGAWISLAAGLLLVALVIAGLRQRPIAFLPQERGR